MSDEAGTHAEGVIGFYDRHPINEDEILAKLAAKFGAAHFDAWDRTYAFFVGLFVAGRLGGTRIVARRAAA